MARQVAHEVKNPRDFPSSLSAEHLRRVFAIDSGGLCPDPRDLHGHDPEAGAQPARIVTSSRPSRARPRDQLSAQDPRTMLEEVIRPYQAGCLRASI